MSSVRNLGNVIAWNKIGDFCAYLFAGKAIAIWVGKEDFFAEI